LTGRPTDLPGGGNAWRIAEFNPTFIKALVDRNPKGDVDLNGCKGDATMTSPWAHQQW
jgi:hypothetical protein